MQPTLAPVPKGAKPDTVSMADLEVTEDFLEAVERLTVSHDSRHYNGNGEGDAEWGLLQWSWTSGQGDDDLEQENEFAPLFEQELERIEAAYRQRVGELLARYSDVVGQVDSAEVELQPLGTRRDGDPGTRLAELHADARQLRDKCLHTAAAFKSILNRLKGKMHSGPFNELRMEFERSVFVSMVDLNSLLDNISMKFSQVTGKTLAGPSLTQEEVQVRWAWKKRWLGLAIVVTALLLIVPVMGKDQGPANRCLAMVSGVIVLWVTEALPFYVTAILIPVLTVLFRIYSVPAPEAAQLVFEHMFNHTTALVLGGFSMSSAFSKYGFEKRLIGVLRMWLGHRPRLFLLSLMAVGWFFSMFISNVAAPVLCLSVVMPLLHSLPTNSRYAKATLLGLALACNIGGMLSPISSPQNAIALGALDKAGFSVSFVQWMAVSLPFCLVLLVLAWAYLLVLLKPNDLAVIPPLPPHPTRPLGPFEWIVLVTSAVTILLWCTLGLTKQVLGDMGIVAMLPLGIFLSTGVLTKDDFLAFGWNLIMLIAGGNVLGAAVAEAKLLDIVAGAAVPGLRALSPWGAFAAITSLCLVATTPLSHTVGAIVLSPMIVSIGKELGNPQVLVVGAAFMFSAAMALPTSSFPNINSLCAEDSAGRPYLHAMDFVRSAGPFSLLALALALTMAYALLLLVFG